MTHRIELDGLTVTVEDDGEERPPWNDVRGSVFKYRVHVEAPEETYDCPAWGSLHDRERGERDYEGIGWMVLDELQSAAYDPDEFFSMATDGDGGRERAVSILALISTAEGMLPALERNEDAINDHR